MWLTNRRPDAPPKDVKGGLRLHRPGHSRLHPRGTNQPSPSNRSHAVHLSGRLLTPRHGRLRKNHDPAIRTEQRSRAPRRRVHHQFRLPLLAHLLHDCPVYPGVQERLLQELIDHGAASTR